MKYYHLISTVIAIFKYLHKGHSIEITYIWILYLYSHTLAASILEHF